MPQTIHRGIKALIDEANAEIETLSATEAIKAAQSDDVVIVDIRDPREIERDGRIPGAFSCTRGMLEFWIDPASPYAKPVFQQEKKFIFHCAGGMRSALAAKTARRSGREGRAQEGEGLEPHDHPPSSVMPGLVPGIHVLEPCGMKDVDGWDV
jgi:rhodanese-related sulfurtransferase